MNVYDKATQYGLYGLLEGTDRHSNGNTFFVDSTCGSNTAGGAWGQSWTTPYATLNYAVSKCTTGAGDVILLAPAHAETITATSTASGSSTGQLCVDKGDISIIGLGRGTKRPTFTFTTAAAAGVKIVGTSPNVLLSNLLFIADYTNGITAGITVAANCYGLTIENCEFRETANTKEFLISISLAALIEDVVIRGNRFTGVAGGTCSEAIVCVGAAPRLQVYDNYFHGDWSAACITASAAASLIIMIRDNLFYNLDPTTGKCVVVHAGTTGTFTGNYMHAGKDATNPLTSTVLMCCENYATNIEAESGNLAPAAGDWAT